MKRTVTFLLTVAMLCSFIPAASYNAKACPTYVVQNTTVPLSGYSDGAPSYGYRQCWAFAQKVYRAIWGRTFNGYRSTLDDMLRNVGTGSARAITAENTKKFITAAALGATIRIAEIITGADSDGENIHSQILVQKDAKGFTVYHSTDSHIGLDYYTWAQYASYWRHYKFFKYIKFPKAPVFSAQTALLPLFVYKAPAPANAVLSVSKNRLLAGENTVFRFGADYVSGGHYVLHLYKGKTNIDNPDVRSGRYTASFDELGTYWAYVTAYNSSGLSCVSGKVYFSVLPPTPGVPRLTVAGENSSAEPVTFTWAETWATTKYKLTIYDGDGEKTIDSITGTTCSAEFPVGEYSAKLTSINGNCHDLESESSVVAFKVVPPLYCKTNRTVASFKWTADSKATAYNLRIMKTENNAEKLYCSVLGTTGTSCSRGSLPEGSYRAYVDAVGSDGYRQKSCDVYFTVSYVHPSKPKLSVAAATKSADPVQLAWNSADNAKNYSVSIWKGSTLVKTASRIKGTSYSVMLDPGTYTACVTAVNTDYPNCKTASDKSSFKVTP